MTATTISLCVPWRVLSIVDVLPAPRLQCVEDRLERISRTAAEIIEVLEV